MNGELIVGMMSGTSADGIDAVLVDFVSDSKFEVLTTHYCAFSAELSNRINRLAHSNDAQADDSEALALDRQLADDYARACHAVIDKARMAKSEITAIANHGQTVAHRPNDSPPESLQLGNAQRIADLCGLPVISQFRQKDLSAGGQGAPLMPAFHRVLAAHDDLCFFINLGGIANISMVKQNQTLGFDTGPANTLMNQWVAKHLGKPYDSNGDWAASGAVVPKLLETLLQDDWFALPYPKSTGPDYFNLDWLNQRVSKLNRYRPQDVQASLLALSVESIALGLHQLNAAHGQIYLCGGGVHNDHLRNALASRLNTFEVSTTDTVGVPPDWVEAVGFAWLGYCFLHDLPSNCPSVTGARKDLVLGELYRPE